jgi:hypothetical protein
MNMYCRFIPTSQQSALKMVDRSTMSNVHAEISAPESVSTISNVLEKIGAPHSRPAMRNVLAKIGDPTGDFQNTGGRRDLFAPSLVRKTVELVAHKERDGTSIWVKPVAATPSSDTAAQIKTHAHEVDRTPPPRWPAVCTFSSEYHDHRGKESVHSWGSRERRIRVGMDGSPSLDDV